MKTRTKKHVKKQSKKTVPARVVPSVDVSSANTVFGWNSIRVEPVEDKRRKIIIGAIKQLAELL